MKCSQCRFWHQISTEDNDRGECRRYAPRAGSSEPGDNYVRWAETFDNDWCGEFEFSLDGFCEANGARG